MAERIGTFLDTPSMIFARLSSFPKVFRSARVSFPFGKMDRIRSQYMFSVWPQFSVDPGSDPHRSLHPQFPDKRYKGTQIILSLKVENAFLFLVAEPGHIGRHQFNASGLHL